MEIFKLAYRVVRKNSNEIFRGFGFHHLSDATQYYVHINNQSYNGKTTLCQSIGESVTLFKELVNSIMSESDESMGNYYYSEDKREVFLDIDMPQQWRENGIIDENIYSYKVYVKDCLVELGAYDEYGKWIDGNMEHFRELYKLLPVFTTLMAKDMENNEEFRTLVLSYIHDVAVDTFVNVHEDFYQQNKLHDYEIEYIDLSSFDVSQFISFSHNYNIIKENKKNMSQEKKQKIIPFMDNEFLKEYIEFIPSVGEEYEMPYGLESVCNAITCGDVMSVLLHGPAGTGKTMACKLIAKAIKIPIMETINCTENLDEYVLGKFLPEGEHIVFKESYVTKAIRFGGAVVFEEINFARPQYLSFLNSLLDDNGFVKLDNGYVVQRHKNFRFFATMNMGYFGTKELNQSLYNRFNNIIEISELSDIAIRKMLITRVPQCKGVIEKIISVYHKIKKKINNEELDIVISPRNLENWVRMAKYEGYMRAAEKTIIPVAKCDRVMEKAIRGILQIYRWDQGDE